MLWIWYVWIAEISAIALDRRVLLGPSRGGRIGQMMTLSKLEYGLDLGDARTGPVAAPNAVLYRELDSAQQRDHSTNFVFEGYAIGRNAYLAASW